MDTPTGKVMTSQTTIYVPGGTSVGVEDKIVLEDTTTVHVTSVRSINDFAGNVDHKVIYT